MKKWCEISPPGLKTGFGIWHIIWRIIQQIQFLSEVQANYSHEHEQIKIFILKFLKWKRFNCIYYLPITNPVPPARRRLCITESFLHSLSPSALSWPEKFQDCISSGGCLWWLHHKVCRQKMLAESLNTWSLLFVHSELIEEPVIEY